MARSSAVTRLLRGRRSIIEAYAVHWHGRGFAQEMLCVRVVRLKSRCEITHEVLARDDNANWCVKQSQTRMMTAAEWHLVHTLTESQFWKVPERAAASAMLDGDCWTIEGYRDQVYHSVYRHTGHAVEGNDDGIYDVGERLCELAGLQRFRGNQ